MSSEPPPEIKMNMTRNQGHSIFSYTDSCNSLAREEFI